MRFLLINPKWDGLVGRDRRYNRPWPPLSLLYCASLLREAGHEVSLIDGRADRHDRTRIDVAAAGADWIILTSSPLDRWQCPNLDVDSFFSFAKSLPEEKLVLCGVHGTIFPDKILESTGARFVIRGEPEAAVIDFIRRGEWETTAGLSYPADRKTFHNPVLDPLDLADLPLPAYELAPPEDYRYELLGERLALLESSRGCPFHCPFCLKIMFGDGYRIKPLDRLMEEIDLVVKRFAFRSIYFIDLEFVVDKTRAKQICQAMTQKNLDVSWACQTRMDSLDENLLEHMYRAGCRLIHIGIETGLASDQDRMNKRICSERAKAIIDKATKLGIATACFYLFGFPGETEADRVETLRLARALNSTYASFHVLAPYPTTDFFESSCASADLFPCVCPEHSRSESYDWERKAIKRYYLRPRHAVRNMRLWLKQGNILKKIRLFKEFLW